MIRSFNILYILTFLMILSLFSCSRTGKVVQELEAYLEIFRAEHIADTRTSLWKMNVDAGEELVLDGLMADRELYLRLKNDVDTHFPMLDFKVVCLPEEGEAGLVNGLVNNSVIHLRREPSSKSELLTQALLGTPVSILLVRDGKCLIQVPDGYLGWVNTPEIQRLEEEELENYKSIKKIIFTRQYGFCYSEPSTASLPVTDLVIGSLLAVDSAHEDFFRVRYPDRREGWVLKEESRDAREILGQEPCAKGLIRTALPYHGIPYLWGGASAKNIDCSGFVSNVFFLNGIQMPRDADMQSLCGRELSHRFDPGELEPGDLLFFGRRATEQNDERVNHVAIYLGDKKFIHAAGFRERVSINSMDSLETSFIPTYPEIFVRAVRILNEEGGDFHPVLENHFYQQIFNNSPG